MSGEKIIVYIDPSQVAAQKKNDQSLFLAKKVNGVFAVIWQSMGPFAAAGQPSYEYKNTFIIQIPSYQVNYGTVAPSSGGSSSAGDPVTINLGQTVTLDENGLFDSPKNNGPAGTITIDNFLAGTFHEVLADSSGNPIFLNVVGMEIGFEFQLTPVDEYQIWFDNFQETGTVIANNVSGPAVVVFAGEVSKTISYLADGTWTEGPLTSNRRIDYGRKRGQSQ